MNLKHGFYSKKVNINPDSVMLGRALMGSHDLHALASLFDNERLTAGQLLVAFNVSAPRPLPEGVESLKDWLWWLCGNVERTFPLESPQARYANLAAMVGSAIVEFCIDAGMPLYDYIVVDPEPYSLTSEQVHMNSLMTKLRKLRRQF